MTIRYPILLRKLKIFIKDNKLQATEKGKGGVFWITGLSGSGKSTLATNVASLLRARGLPTVLLDGDELRELHQNLGGGYDRDSRLRTAKFNSSLCKLLADQSLYVVCPTISLFHEIQEWNRSNIARYVEIFIEANINDLKKIDVKKIYSNYDEGKINNVVGLDLTAEYPKKPDLVIKYKFGANVKDVSIDVINHMIEKNEN
jgi:adenylylsulfate kinase-like enzyme